VVARNTGEVHQGIARVQEAQRTLQQIPFDPEMRKLRVFMDLAEAYREADQLPEAIDAFEQASVRLTALGRDETETAGTLFNNWALALQQIGRPIDAEPIYRRAIDISRADRSEQGVSPMLLNNYAFNLSDLARFDQAAGYAERAYARAQEAGDEVVINQSLFVRAGIYRNRHDFPRAAAMLAEVEPRLRKDLLPGHYAFGMLLSQRSLLALERGDLPSALRLGNQAVDLLEAAAKRGKAGRGFLPLMYQRRAKVELQAGRLDAAEVDTERALNLLPKGTQPRGFSSESGRSYLLRARVCKAQGKDEEAHAAAKSAVQHLESGLGPDHPDTRSARQLIGFDQSSK
jgi:tetratricopeptide (TPR) repeat protein